MMINRKTGFCANCNSNVVHVRVFGKRLTYALDRMTFSVFGRMGLGPWQCVDCGTRNMRLQATRRSAREVSEQADSEDTQLPVGNFLKTEQALVHASSNDSRYSAKFRMGIVEKLCESSSTISRTCQELGISELELQRWFREYVDYQIQRVTNESSGSLITAESAGLETDESLNWSAEESGGLVIESPRFHSTDKQARQEENRAPDEVH